MSKIAELYMEIEEDLIAGDEVEVIMPVRHGATRAFAFRPRTTSLENATATPATTAMTRPRRIGRSAATTCGM